MQRRWSSDLPEADREDSENLNTSRVLVNRFKHQEVSHEDTRPFPCEDWTVELFDHTVVQHSLRETSCQTKQDEMTKQASKMIT